MGSITASHHPRLCRGHFRHPGRGRVIESAAASRACGTCGALQDTGIAAAFSLQRRTCGDQGGAGAGAFAARAAVFLISFLRRK
jgi:hypothetical protein